MKEAKDSSPVDHTSILLFRKSIHTTRRVSHLQAIGKRFLPMHIHSLASFLPSQVDPTRAHILWELNMQAQ